MIQHNLLKVQTVFMIGLFLSAAGFSKPALGCSRVFWSNNGSGYMLTGRTMDLPLSDQPQLVVFPRGQSHIGGNFENAAAWTTQYGTVVVTALGNQNIVTEGMNLSGLAAHMLYLDGSKYEPRDQRPGVSVFLWCQYVLDNARTVQEALDLHQTFQVVPAEKVQEIEILVHLIIEDATGDSAIIEFTNGKMTVFHNSAYRVATNEPTYDQQLANLTQYKPFNPNGLPLPGDIDPKSRFVRASAYLSTLPQPASLEEGVTSLIGLLRNLSSPAGALDYSGPVTDVGWPTFWYAVSDLNNLVFYMTLTDQDNLFWIDMKKINFSAQMQYTKSLDLNNPALVGDVTGKLKTDAPPCVLSSLFGLIVLAGLAHGLSRE
jgi:penicillin V acylase-like amidase (Ntn superfamily)